MVGIAAGIGYFMAKNRRSKGTPVDLADLSKSAVAAKYGVDNGVPNALLPEALGLVVVVGEMLDAGLPITSMYRSPVVQALVEFENANPGQTANLATLAPQGGFHTLCRAVDVDADNNDAALDRAIVKIRSLPLTRMVLTRTLKEGNHVHCEFSRTALITLGQQQNTEVIV
jgi:hypothetical protein